MVFFPTIPDLGCTKCIGFESIAQHCESAEQGLKKIKKYPSNMCFFYGSSKTVQLREPS